MGTDIKLKDLFGQTQTEQDISTVSVPKADGTGREFYVKRPVIYYRLVASPPYAPQEGDSIIIYWNLGDGGLDYADEGNSLGRCHEAVEGKTTKPIVRVSASKYLEGVSADNSGYAHLIYLEEAVPGQTLIDILLGVTGTADFIAQPGWGQLIQGADGQTYTYTQLTDLSGIAIGIEQPNNILSQRLFYSFLTEKTNSDVAYTAAKNGAHTIVPPAESSGISTVNLTVDVPEPNLQDKSVEIAENGTQEFLPDTGYDGIKKLTAKVNVAGGGTASSAKCNDVTFIDYDGSVLYSYSLAEAHELMELPALPSHDGLVCQGWNWTLEEIKALNRPVTVGAMYITDDGATRLHIRIATVGRMTVPLYIGQTVANGVSIDWGDGSTAETLSGTGNVNTSHTYAEPGDYVILLMPTDGCTLSFGTNSSSYCVMGSTENQNKVYCNMLQDVSIGKNVTSIGDYAFNGCYSLASITIPTGVTSIGSYAFNYCYSIASITIPDGVTSISRCAFQFCNSIASITIPDGVTSIGDYAFNGCNSLVSITIPTGVTSIGSYALSSCNSLASITIPTGVTSIGEGVFYNSNSIASITIPDGVTSISNRAFHFCYSLASITIPTGVTSIGDTAFSGCRSIASITIPDGVTSIGDYAFNGCNSLVSITIPTGVTSIGDYAFNGCYSLASITIPTGVTSIGDSAFSACYGMRYYDFSACTAIPKLSNRNAFDNIPSDCQMLIPSALYNNWKSATNWAAYANYMVPV